MVDDKEAIIRALATDPNGSGEAWERARAWVQTEREKGMGEYLSVSFTVRFSGSDLLSEVGMEAIEDWQAHLRALLVAHFGTEVDVERAGSLGMAHQPGIVLSEWAQQRASS